MRHGWKYAIPITLAGALLLLAALWRGGETLRAANQSQPFSVTVERRLASARVLGPFAKRSWWGQFEPAADASRVVVKLDGEAVDAGNDAKKRVDLKGVAPGYHFVEVALERRGGRREVIHDAILAGPFGPRWRDEPGCGLAAGVSERALKRLFLPALEETLLKAMRKQPLMGKDVTLPKAEVTLIDGGAKFAFVIAGENRLEIEGVVEITTYEKRRLQVKLTWLGKVEFTGKLRSKVTKIGAGSGAAVGAMVTGPLAPVGAYIGYVATDKYVTQSARKEVRKQVEKALKQAQTFELFPEEIQLVPGDVRTRLRIQWCEDLAIRSGGVVGRISVQPLGFPTDVRWPVPGPIQHGVDVLTERMGEEEDLRVELSIDLANALLDAWSAEGLLADIVEASGLVQKANRELHPWTPMRVISLKPGLPPVLDPAHGSDHSWGVAMAGLAVELEGARGVDGETIVLNGEGELEPRWEPETGRLALGGRLHRLSVTCARALEDGLRLRPCFGQVMDAADVTHRIDQTLVPGAQTMPGFDLRGLIQEKIGMPLTSLEVRRPERGLLRLSGALEVDPQP